MSINIDGMTAYSIKETVNLLKGKGNKVSITMLKNYIKAGHIKATNINGEYWIKECDIDWGMSDGPIVYGMEEDTSYENMNQGINQSIQKEILKI